MTRSLFTAMQSAAAVAFLTLLTIATATNALAQQQAIRGKVPFSFNVGNKVLPAGEYVVYPVSSDVLEIRSTDNRVGAVIAGTQSFHDASRGARLEFHLIGESRFLSRVLSDSHSSLNVEFEPGQAEKAARERETSLQASTQVEVAMK